MAPTSHMLKQHIAEVEQWITKTVVPKTEYTELVDLGCIAKDGVLFRDTTLGVLLTPEALSGNFSNLLEEHTSRLFKILTAYFALLRDLDPEMVRYAVELDDRRGEYEVAAINEILDNKGILWLRDREGVSKIQTIRVQDKMNFRKLEYYDLSTFGKERKIRSLRFVRLFLTREDAYNPLKEGFHDR